MNGQWSFLHFQRKIIGTPSPEAYAGIKWTWAAKVWDPQCSAQNIKASFSSPELPNWLSWRGNLLTGVPTLDLIGRSYHIIVRAITNHNSKPSSLDMSFNLSIKSPDEMGDYIFHFLLPLSLMSIQLIHTCFLFPPMSILKLRVEKIGNLLKFLPHSPTLLYLKVLLNKSHSILPQVIRHLTFQLSIHPPLNRLRQLG
jgi:hypothetical protein